MSAYWDRMTVAAPDLLAALKGAVEALQADLDALIEQGPPKEWRADAKKLRKLIDAGNAAIAKAEGRRP